MVQHDEKKIMKSDPSKSAYDDESMIERESWCFRKNPIEASVQLLDTNTMFRYVLYKAQQHGLRLSSRRGRI